MTAVKAAEVDRALARRNPEANLFLFYGPDAGRVSERARVAAHQAVDDAQDPFQLIRLDGDALADEPGRLVEEASTFGLFGGRRAIWVRAAGRSIAPAVAACLDVSLADTVVVVEAGDLAKGAPLRTLCEGSARALALPCYPDEAKDLGTTITDALRGYGLSIAPDARDILIESLGGDRLATQSEIQKLALYAHGSGTVTSEDVEAIVSDVSGAGVDAAIDAAFAGDRVELDHALEQLARQGTSHATTLALSLRHGLTLLSSVVKASEGQETDILIRNWRGLHFRRKATVSRQLRLWTPSRLSQAVIALHSAVLLSRRSAALADVAASQALFGVAARARSASRDT